MNIKRLDNVVIDDNLRLETSKSMPPKSPPLIENKLNKTYNDLKNRLVDSNGNVTFLSVHDVSLLAHDLNVASTQLLNFVQGDWRMIIVATMSIDRNTEAHLRFITMVFQPLSCFILGTLWNNHQLTTAV